MTIMLGDECNSLTHFLHTIKNILLNQRVTTMLLLSGSSVISYNPWYQRIVKLPTSYQLKI